MRNAIVNMKGLDMFVNSMNDAEYREIQKHLTTTDRSRVNFTCFDLYRQYFDSLLNTITISKDLYTLKRLAKKLDWSTNVEDILTNNSFEALVVTDLSRKIVWVNDGFSSMTGYSKQDAINKSPYFLQGSRTSEETRDRIRKKLALNQPFKEVIINHRKDNTTYKCELHIFPLYNENTTHFLALEKRIA